MHLPITQIITLNPEMHSITGNIDVAVQDQPIADLSAHALILKPRSLRILDAWEASQIEEGDLKVRTQRVIEGDVFRILLEAPAILPTSQLPCPMPWKLQLLGRPRRGAEKT